jgi:plasmid stabilization system protein ParE
MDFNLIYSKQADKEIDQIHDYVAMFNPGAAEKIVRHIRETAIALRDFPRIGGRVAERYEIESNSLFFVANPYPYIIFYEIIKNNVVINRVLDGRRDCVSILQ